MKIVPYLVFRGNCVKAIAFYEKAFGVKADFCQYKDAAKFEPGYPVKKEDEKLVMHCDFKIKNDIIMQMADMPADCGCGCGSGCACSNVFLSVTFKTEQEVKDVYNVLKVGGKVDMKLSKCFWSPCYGEVVDKFGVKWLLMQEEAAK